MNALKQYYAWLDKVLRSNSGAEFELMSNVGNSRRIRDALRAEALARKLLAKARELVYEEMAARKNDRRIRR